MTKNLMSWSAKTIYNEQCCHLRVPSQISIVDTPSAGSEAKTAFKPCACSLRPLWGPSVANTRAELQNHYQCVHHMKR